MKSVAIVGAGAAGLMAADVLSGRGVQVSIFEQMPTAGRKILWAGKTGLNVSHSEPMADFVTRYTPAGWLDGYVADFTNDDVRAWLDGLGVPTFVGSSGRIFPVAMKASQLIRAWLHRLATGGVAFYYRHECTQIDQNTLTITDKSTNTSFTQAFDAIILACGGGSYARLGSTGAWQAWFDDDALSALYASNVGVVRTWSPYMTACFGKALKRVKLTVGDESSQGDIIISHYGLESGLIYKYNRQMRDDLMKSGHMIITLDLLPDKHKNDVTAILSTKKKSLNTLLKKAGLDNIKIALLRECTDKDDWLNADKMAVHIKSLSIVFDGFRPIDEAISTGGGVKRSALGENLQLKSNPYVFCCGEMLDFDAPTGGYLLTACFATGRAAADGVGRFLGLSA